MKNEAARPESIPVRKVTERPISIAIVAMGGQGGGVLTNWVVDLAESQGWMAQSTSVPGVAQRTGATIYYVEMMQKSDTGQAPVFAQMPTPGDVDLVMASEFMEAGRSILRGFVTPDRTTLIASSHRSLAVTEKVQPGKGIADSVSVSDAIGLTAKRTIVFDMNEMATKHGSVISAALFGVLAASELLPFEKANFEEVIRKAGKGVGSSLLTFNEAFERTLAPEKPDVSVDTPPSQETTIPKSLPNPEANRLLLRLENELPEAVLGMAFKGLKKVVGFQDAAYGDQYIQTLKGLYETDLNNGGEVRNFAFTSTAAKYLANAMVYDDIARVADLKTREERLASVASAINLQEGQIFQTTEYFHPRGEELLSALPVGLAKSIMRRKWLFDWIDRRVSKVRRIPTYSLCGFLALVFVAGFGRIRHRSLRHETEMQHINSWLADASKVLNNNYDLAVQVLQFRRLIKGYSDTHARGQSKFDKAMKISLRVADREDAAVWAKRLLNAAISDPTEESLDGVIDTIKTFL